MSVCVGMHLVFHRWRFPLFDWDSGRMCWMPKQAWRCIGHLWSHSGLFSQRSSFWSLGPVWIQWPCFTFPGMWFVVKVVWAALSSRAALAHRAVLVEQDLSHLNILVLVDLGLNVFQAALGLVDVLCDLVDPVELQEQGLEDRQEAVQGSLGLSPLSGHDWLKTICVAGGGGVGGDVGGRVRSRQVQRFGIGGGAWR